MARAAGRRLVLTVLAALLLTGIASAHYPFLHYTSSTGPFTPVPEKFDIATLPNGVLQYFVAESGPAVMAPGDSFTSLISQVRLAARTWSDVATSQLRLEFGGLTAPATLQTTPGIDVLFDELPPGLVAMGGPTTRSGIVSAESGSFVPILRSVLILQKDLSQRPSYGDAFYLTAVHELGHALGLQHTLSSSAMATQVTRATTRSVPLAADDVAGISTLYPAAGFASQTGTITGRVTLDGQGVHLASVVVIAPGGTVVTALADPDGYYRMTGVPPGSYYLYVHPLPPANQPELGPADVVLPVDPEGNPFPAGPLFQTQFYPGTKDYRQAQVISLTAGELREGLDFAVAPSGSLDLYGVTTYSFPGNYAVKPAFVNMHSSRNFLVASGVGLISNNAPSEGLRADVIGGSANIADGGVKAYEPAPAFLQLDLQFNPFSGPGQRHILFTRNENIYILPAGVTLVRRQPPTIASVTPGVDEKGRGIATLGGRGFLPTTRILFDGVPAEVFSVDEAGEFMMVAPPPGVPNHQAVVTALNSDGQSSLFVDALAVPAYHYDAAESPLVVLTPNSLPAGSEAMIEINGINTHFAEGQTVVGFGTSDIAVRRVWVITPTRLMANVRIAPAASPLPVNLTVMTGLEVVGQPGALLVQPENPLAIVANPELVNPVTGLPSVYAGGTAEVTLSNLPENAAVSITVNDYPSAVLSAAAGKVVFSIPSEVPLGPVVLRVQVGSEIVAPIVAPIDFAPPVIVSVLTAPDAPVDANRPAAHGQSLTVIVSGLADPGVSGSPERVRVTVGGVDHVPARVSLSGSDPNVHLIEFTLSSSVPAGTSVPLTVRIGDRRSEPFGIAILAPPPAQP